VAGAETATVRHRRFCTMRRGTRRAIRGHSRLPPAKDVRFSTSGAGRTLHLARSSLKRIPRA
jgi:hypothetical protein